MPARTRRQREILNYITDFIESRGHQPSYQQIANHFKLSSRSGIAKHIRSLENQGLISRRGEGGGFNLRLNGGKFETNENLAEILWAKIPEMKDPENSFEYEPFFIPKFLLNFRNPRNLRLFYIADDALSEDHIVFGDHVFVEKEINLRDGDTVLAIISGKKSVLRKFYRDGAFIELRPSNNSYELIRVAANKVDLRGVYRGLFRPL